MTLQRSKSAHDVGNVERKLWNGHHTNHDQYVGYHLSQKEFKERYINKHNCIYSHDKHERRKSQRCIVHEQGGWQWKISHLNDKKKVHVTDVDTKKENHKIRRQTKMASITWSAFHG